MHPCCNGSLQTGTKIIAIVHLLFAILAVALGVIFSSGGALATYFIHNDQTLMPADERGAAAVGSLVIFIGICIIVGGVLSILSSAVLLSGATKRNHTRCLIWFVLNAISLVLHLLFAIVAASLSVPLSGPHIALSTIGILIQSYFLWVVWAFMAEIKEAVEVAFYGGLKPKV